jgi:hypothetical protein
MFQHPDFIPLLSAKKRLLLQGVKTTMEGSAKDLNHG